MVTSCLDRYEPSLPKHSTMWRTGAISSRAGWAPPTRQEMWPATYAWDSPEKRRHVSERHSDWDLRECEQRRISQETGAQGSQEAPDALGKTEQQLRRT